MTLRIFIVFSLVVGLLACNSADQKNNTNSEKKEVKDTIQLRIDSLSKAIRKTPKSDTLFYQRSMLHIANGDIQKAVRDLEVAKKLNKDEVTYYLELAEIELRRGESGISKDILESANKRFPENVEVMIRLANIYMAVDDYKEARTKLILASRIEPRNPDLYMLSSIIFQEIGKIDRAKEELYQALKYDPDYYDAHVMLGLINARQGKEIAIDHYLNAINAQPKNPEAIYNLAMYYQNNGKYDKAIDLYERGLNEIDSTLQHFLFNMGYVLENFKSNPESAIGYYQKVVNYYPEDYRAFFRMGKSYEMLNEPQKAMSNYEMCLRVNPDFDEAYKALSRLSEEHNKNR